jgi:hypothetical protein
MRILCLYLAALLLTTGALRAQTPLPPTARVSFEQRWPEADPQWFELLIQSDGSAKYRSLPHQSSKPSADDSAPEPYEFSITLTPHSRQMVFDVASGLPRFQGSLDKIKVAFTGTKTLHYDGPDGSSSSLTYNYSSSPELTAFTDLMQGISQTIEISQTLGFQQRFDKLALDSTLRGTEELVSGQRLPEAQILQPVLERIANDPTVMNIARQRARRILQTPSAAKPK